VVRTSEGAGTLPATLEPPLSVIVGPDASGRPLKVTDPSNPFSFATASRGKLSTEGAPYSDSVTAVSPP